MLCRKPIVPVISSESKGELRNLFPLAMLSLSLSEMLDFIEKKLQTSNKIV